jgi:hypothetical protein
MAEEYEYMVVYNDSEECLSAAGEKGWEVVQIREVEELCSEMDKDTRERLDACPYGVKIPCFLCPNERIISYPKVYLRRKKIYR